MKNKQKSLFTNAFWNILSVAITAIAGFILVPVIINAIGEENFGIYAIILMIGGFAQLQSLGLGEATLKYVAQYYAKNDIDGVNRVLGATLSVYIFSGLLVSGIIVTCAEHIIGWFNLGQENVSHAISALRIAGGTFLISIFGSAFKAIPEATQRYDLLSKYNLVMMIFRYGTMYIIAINGRGIIELTYLTLASAAVDVFVYAFLAKRLILGLRILPNFSKKGINEVFSYGIYSFVNDLVQRVALYVDQFILGIFFNAASVAYLTAPKDLISKAQGLTGAASQALFPRFSSMDEGHEMQKLYITSLWALSVMSIVIFIPLSVVIPAFLSVWISPEFSENSSEFARFFSFGVAFNGGVSAYFALLKGTGRVKWLTNIVLTLTVASGIITAILVYNFGVIGSALRVIIFSWVGSLLCIYIGKKVFKDFKTLRISMETTILPVLVGLIFFILSSHFLFDLNGGSWIEVVAVYFALSTGLVFTQFGINWIFYRSSGIAAFILLKFENKVLRGK